jgi:cell division protein ZipA
MELRNALLLIGVVVIALVALHTYNASRRRRRERSDPYSNVKSEPPRLNPVTGLDFNPTLEDINEKRTLAPDAAPQAPVARRDAFKEELETLEEVATMPLNLDAGLRNRPRHLDLGRPALPDEKIDFIMRLPAGAAAVLRDEALGVYKQHEFDLEKPHRLYGCRVESDLWSELQHDSQRTRYGDLALSIQLVDPRGPIDETELHKFSQLGLQLADVLQRRTQFSMPFEEAVERAKALHAFCEQFDVIAAVHVVAQPGNSFKGQLLEHAARKLGMQWGARSIFHMKNEMSPGSLHLFSLANLSGSGAFPAGQWERFQVTGVTFFMSVPCTHRPATAFDKMISAAQSLAETLSGELQDQARRPLTPAGIVAIRHQVESIEERMRAGGIVPGSQTALRLFADDAVGG